MYNYRVCQELGHQEYQIQHLCTYRGCDKCVFLCSICIQKDIHNHGQSRSDHIVNLKQFQQQTLQIRKSIYDQYQRKANLIKNVQSIAETLSQEIIAKIRKQNFEEILLIIQETLNYDFIKPDNLSVKKIINVQDQINQQDKILVQIEKNYIQKLQDLVNTIKDYDQNVPISLEKANFNNHSEYYCQKGIEAAHISANETFMALGQNNNKLTIVNLKTKETIKKIDFNSPITSCRFSESNFLFVGDQIGFLYCYDDNFDEIYNQQLYFSQVKGIKFINNQKIVTFSDYQILVCDLDAMKQLEIKCSQFLMGIDYYKLQDKIISFYQDVNFHDCQTGKCVFKSQNMHNKQSILQIQLIEQKSQMISSNENTLILWGIDLDHMMLSKFKQINLNNISNVSAVSDGNLMIILKNCIQFYDGQLNKLKDFEISEAQRKNKQDLTKIVCMMNIEQISSMNFIIILRKGSLQVLKKAK